MYETGVIEVISPKYPKLLKEALGKLIPSLGPKKLYYKGTWNDELFQNCLAVVGSRRLTQYGQKATLQLVGELAAAGVTIVSGFMYGGDKAAHESAIAGGGKTIAVMPCGINLVHPPGQEKLYEDILKTGGLIISEYEDKTQPQTYTYVQRDRIVAGLSKALFVTEASLNSGSLITASYATKFGRKIFALPGQITSEVAKGTTKLIREGAEAVMEAGDILAFFDKKSVQRSMPTLVGGNELEHKIIGQLQNEPMNADDMARMFALPVAQVGTTLSLMEMRGLVSQADGKYYIS